MKSRPVLVYRSDGVLECHVLAFGDSPGFDSLCAYLEQIWHGVEMWHVDGPDARRAVYNVTDAEIILDYDDPYGITIRSPSNLGDHVLQAIADDLRRRLSQKTE